MAAHHKVDNLTLIVDRNGLQSDGHTEDVMRMDLEALWRCHWETIVCDGHDVGRWLTLLHSRTTANPKLLSPIPSRVRACPSWRITKSFIAIAFLHNSSTMR
jgi:hypothetical protein